MASLSSHRRDRAGKAVCKGTYLQGGEGLLWPPGQAVCYAKVVHYSKGRADFFQMVSFLE